MALHELLQDPDELRRRVADLTIDSATCWVPDEFLARTCEGPAHFALRLHADTISWLSVHGCRACVLTLPERGALVDAALAVLRRGPIGAGADTAIGRYVTTTNVAASLPGLPDDEQLRRTTSLAINHYDHGGRTTPEWPQLLDTITRSIGAKLAHPDREQLAFLRAHFSQG